MTRQKGAPWLVALLVSSIATCTGCGFGVGFGARPALVPVAAVPVRPVLGPVGFVAARPVVPVTRVTTPVLLRREPGLIVADSRF